MKRTLLLLLAILLLRPWQVHAQAYGGGVSGGGLTSVPGGGTGCPSPLLFANLPTNPAPGTSCTVKDPTQTCSGGTQITSGTGTANTPYCNIVNLGTSSSPTWYAAGVSTASSGVNSGTSGQLAYYAATGSTVSGETNATVAQGGTAATTIGGWPINLVHTQTVSGATNESLQNAWTTTEVFTFSASATVTLPQGSWAGQTLNGMVCQNGTGGFTPTFAAAGGLTITGTFPTFTTTASKCGDFSVTYTTTTQAYLTGSTAGPL